MNFEELLNNKKIQKVEKEEFDSEIAERDIKTSKENLDLKNFDWALVIAYNAVLQAGRKLMFSMGYRPIGSAKNKVVFDFLKILEIDEDLTDYFDSIRKTRNSTVYDLTGNVTETMAEEVIEQAEVFVRKIRTFVQKNRTEDDKDYA